MPRLRTTSSFRTTVVALGNRIAKLRARQPVESPGHHGLSRESGLAVSRMRRPFCARHAALALSVVVAVLAACRGGSASVIAPELPEISAATVLPNPHNVLSAVVDVRVRGADRVAVSYTLDGAAAGSDSLTPALPVSDDSVAVPVLGLLPARQYVLRAVAYGPNGTTRSEPLAFTTDALPSDLPVYSTTGSDPSPGFTVLAARQYGLVLDNTGRIVWYRRFPNGPGLNFIAQPNDRYAARPTALDPTDSGRWVEVDVLGNETRSLRCARGLSPRLHDLVAEADGSYWLLCDETRVMDLTAIGGVADALVTGTAVQHVAADGAALFHWSPFDHFAITDVDEKERRGPNVNWTHGNAIDSDADGNLLVSFRNLGEVTKIDVRTGDVLWRLGGRANQFTFTETPMPSFVGQHSARALGSGAILLLDNVGDPSQSRAERYAIDEQAHTARLVQSYTSTPSVVTQIGGSVQPLPDGRTLVSFGTAGRVEEYDASGRVVWRIAGNPGYVFRAQRIRSLYSPGVRDAP